MTKEIKDYYFPRKKFAEQLIKNIQRSDSMNMMLFKERRSGKTSFLIKDLIPEAKKQNNTIPFYLSFMSFGKDDDLFKMFFISFLKQIKEHYSNLNKLKDYIKTIKYFISSIEVKLPLFSINNNQNEDNLNLIETSFNLIKENKNIKIDLNDLFIKFKEIFPDKKLFLLLDEFQELSNLNHSIDFIKSLRTAIDQNSDFVKVIFTGSSYNKLMSFFNDYNQPFYNFGFQLELVDLDEDFLNHVLSVFFNNTGRIDITKENLIKCFEKSNKSPYYITEALKKIENNPHLKLENEFFKILSLDKKFIEKDLLQQKFWNDLSNAEKFVLLALIKFNNKILSKENLMIFKEKEDFLQNQNFSDKQLKYKLHYAIKKLEKKEKIIKDKKDYKIVDLKLKEWIIENSAFEEY